MRAVLSVGTFALVLLMLAACRSTPVATEVEVEVHMTACKATDPATCATVAVPDTTVTLRLPDGTSHTGPTDAGGTARFALDRTDLGGALVGVVATSPFLSGDLSSEDHLPPGGGLLTFTLTDPEIAAVSR